MNKPQHAYRYWVAFASSTLHIVARTDDAARAQAQARRFMRELPQYHFIVRDTVEKRVAFTTREVAA